MGIAAPIAGSGQSAVSAPATSLSNISSPVNFARQQMGIDGVATGELMIVPTHGEPVVIKPGEPIAYALFSTRYCRGYVDRDGEAHLCPNEAKTATDRSSRCESCKDLHYASAATARPGQKAQSPKSGRHVVYLMTIDGRFVKVGTSQKERVCKRIGEQGGRAALVIAEAEGEAEALTLEKAIRKLGHSDRKLAEELGKSQTMPARAMCEGASAPLAPKDVRDRYAAAQELDAICNNDIDGKELVPGLRKLLNDIDHRFNFGCKGQCRVRFLETPQELVFDQPEIWADPELCSKLTEDMRLQGKLTACVGTFAIIEQPGGNTLAITTRSLEGWSLRRVAPSEGEQAGQSEFDFSSVTANPRTPATSKSSVASQPVVVEEDIQLTLSGLAAQATRKRRKSLRQVVLDI